MEKIKTPPNKTANQKSARKWTKKVMDRGFCMVPSLMFRAQKRLGLNSQQFTILLHLMDYWWEDARKPYPAVGTLAERMDLSRRQVRRHLADLEKAGFISRVPRYATHKGRLSNEYDLNGLVKKLQQFAPEFEEAAAQAKKIRESVEKRGANLKMNK